MKLRLLFLIGLMSAHLPLAEADFNQGFCVPANEELVPGKAIVKIQEDFLEGPHGGRRLPLRGPHHFFDPQSDSQILEFHDWGGRMRLEKVHANQDGIIFATYENHAHFFNVPAQNVICRANEF